MGKEFFPSRPELCPMIYEVNVDRRVVQPAGVVDQFAP